MTGGNMLKKIVTATLLGVEARKISVEIDVQPGLPFVHLVGLADTTIKEARERVRAAIVNSGYEYPKQRITISLSPAGIPKEGSHFDLPIAVGVLGTSFCRINTDGFGFIGELSLDGALKGVKGALPLAIRMREDGIKKIVVPVENAQEVSLLKDIDVYPVTSLRQCIEFLDGVCRIDVYKWKECVETGEIHIPDFADVRGNESAKRGLVIAAAGNHGVLMMGSPGCGKTMMAKRIPYILPEMDYEETLEVTKIHSAAGNLNSDYIVSGRRPFRAPHYTITKAALIGGGAVPRPGEISLAHNGVLFLDEFGEFDPAVIELLRQPIEDGVIHISRAKVEADFPCRLMLVAAANPCKCGFLWDEEHLCTCTPRQIECYSSKFSGPMLDRIDMHINVHPVREEFLENNESGLSTGQMKAMVTETVARQKARYRNENVGFNSRLQDNDLKKFCRLGEQEERFIQEAFVKLGLSMRGYNKVLKVSRTIADLCGSEDIRVNHIAEALQYKTFGGIYRR